MVGISCRYLVGGAKETSHSSSSMNGNFMALPDFGCIGSIYMLIAKGFPADFFKWASHFVTSSYIVGVVASYHVWPDSYQVGFLHDAVE
jgi:hypothetical protein